jgi:hypothetical protein
LVRAAHVGTLTLALALAFVSGANADTDDDTPNITGASNGGVASATTGGNISIGTIVTGENTGNSISTGNISGPADLNGGEIDYPTNVNVSQDLSSPIATADGGDGGVASPPFDGSDVTVDINNRDRNNNRSSATGIGEGGAGGSGGTGGDVTVTTTP